MKANKGQQTQKPKEKKDEDIEMLSPTPVGMKSSSIHTAIVPTDYTSNKDAEDLTPTRSKILQYANIGKRLEVLYNSNNSITVSKSL